MDIQTQSALLAAIVTLSIAIGVQIRGRRSRLHQSFAIMNVALAAWNAFAFVEELSEASIWRRLALLSALVIPWTALRFFRAFLGDTSTLAARAETAAMVVPALLLPVLASPLYSNPWLGVVLLAYVFGMLYLCMFFIYRRLQMTQSRVEGARLWYLVIGGVVAITFSLTDHVPHMDVFFPAVGNILTVLFSFFLSQILVQYRLLDLNELFGKIVVMALLGSTLAAIYGVLFYFVGDQQGVLFFTSLVASLVVLILFEPLRYFVEARIGRYNLRERYEFERQLAALRREMANVLEMGPMVQLVFERFENSRRITHASLYLLEDDAHTYKRIGHVGPAPIATLDAVGARGFIEPLREGSWLVREELDDDLLELREDGVPGEGEASARHDRLRRLEAVLGVMDQVLAGAVMPILSDERLIGFLCLWDERVREAFSQEELRAVQEVAQQIAIVVENSRLVEKLRERDRLAALGEMAAGLAHEIRNPLGAIKGAAQLLEDPSDDDPEEMQEFVGIIVEEVDRLNSVVTQFLEYARPDRGHPDPVQLVACVERTVQLLRSAAEEADVALIARVDARLPDVKGDSKRLTQVFLNLGLNAIQATPPGGQLTITMAMGRRRERGLAGLVREVVEVAFADTGQGMPPEVLRNIFIPFYTTKPNGTGLGLPICQRIIRGFGGTIEVHSQLGEGSTFTVQLPPWGEEVITGGVQRDPAARGLGAG